MDFTKASPLTEPKQLDLAQMPGPACSTSMSEEQAAERNDQTRVKVSTGQKPSFMTELEPGSGIYFKAFVTSENDDEVKLRFPGTSLYIFEAFKLSQCLYKTTTAML